MSDTNWRIATGFEPIAAAVARLKRRVDDAISARDEDAAEMAHENLLETEHRMRMAQREEVRRGRG